MATPLLEAERKTAATDLTYDLDLSIENVLSLLDLAAQLKRNPGRFARALTGQYLSLLFEKPSLRTRLTFELAIKQLGGDCVANAGPIGDREPVKDIARNLDRWTNAIVARTFSQRTIEELAQWSNVPVINALSDLYHPCQALADMLTLKEKFGKLRGVKLAFVGDGNNVAHSLMLSSARMGMFFTLAHPKGYEPNAAITAEAANLARESGGHIVITRDPAAALDGANAVYTDVWTSMGQEEESARRRSDFADFQVNESLFAQARKDAIFMHCLPAKRGEETTDGVLECARSAVFDQAENRLHVQKALLLMMLS